jgi:DNA-binding response OmpR family regulator
LGSRILIVEDDPLVSMMLEDYLALLGHQPVACADGVDSALAELASSDIDAAIIDVYLANGETSRPIAEKLAAGEIPFLVSTGGFIAERAPIFADRPLLMKPFTAKSLHQAITGLVGSAKGREA